jgi:hypothetical protein
MPLVESCISLQNRVWKQPNAWNKALDTEAQILDRIIKMGGFEMTIPWHKRRRYDKQPWEVMPPEGERLQKFGSIVRPANDGADHLIMTFQMPKAWDGVATQVMFSSTDASFIQGSGDLVWRLKVGARWIPDFANVTFSLNNLQNPHELIGAYIRLLSLQIVSLYVNVPAASAVDPASRVNAAVVGWQYPKR